MSFTKVIVAAFLIKSIIFKLKKLFQFACRIFFVSMVCSNLEGFLQHKFGLEGGRLVRPCIVPHGVDLYQEIPTCAESLVKQKLSGSSHLSIYIFIKDLIEKITHGTFIKAIVYPRDYEP